MVKKNKKAALKKDYIVPFGTVVVPTKKDNYNALSFWGGISSKKDTRNQVNSWGGSVPSYVKPYKPAVIVNERPFASMFSKNIAGAMFSKNIAGAMFNDNTNRNIFNKLIPRPNKQIPNRKLQGYNFSLGVPQNPLVIENADSRLRGTGSTDIFRLKNEDPFRTGRGSPNAKRSGKMSEVRWIDMINKPKYKEYTSNPFKDSDGDGIMNIFDCRPGNLWYQGDNPNLEVSSKEQLMQSKIIESPPMPKGPTLRASKPKKSVEGFDTVFNDDGTPYKGKGGRPPIMVKKTDVDTQLKEFAKKDKELSTARKDYVELKARVEKDIKDKAEKAEKDKEDAEERVRKQDKVDKKYETDLGKIVASMNKASTAAEKVKLGKELAKIKKDKIKSDVYKKQLETETKMSIARQKGKREDRLSRELDIKLQKLKNIENSKKREAMVSGTSESLYRTSLERENRATIAGRAAEKLTHELWGKKEIKGYGPKVYDKKTKTWKQGKAIYGFVEGKEGDYERLRRKKALEEKIREGKKKGLSQTQITKWENEIALNYGHVTDVGVENLKVKRQEELRTQQAEARKSAIVGSIYNTKENAKKKMYSLGGLLSDEKANKFRIVAEDAAGLAKHAKKQVGKAFQTLGKRDMAKSRMITGTTRNALAGFFNFGGIGGVSGSIFGRGREGLSGSGTAIGDDPRLYNQNTIGENQYSQMLSGGGQTQYEDSGIFTSEPTTHGGAREGAGRREGSYKYGMPIDEYKAMKRQQEQAARIQQAIQEQKITQQMTANTQMSLGLTPGLEATEVATDVMSGQQPMSPTTAGAVMAPGMTIGSGMDVVSGMMNIGGPVHSSQRIFGGLHPEAKTAKIPWLPKDPVMIREQERLPTYFPDKQSAEYASNNQAFSILSLPLGSPLTGAPGGQTYQYAGRIREIKAPQTKNMIMQTQNDGIIKANPTMKANPWGLMIKNRINFSESNIVDEDLRGNVISRDQIGGNIWNAPNMFNNDNRATGNKVPFGAGLKDPGYGTTSIGSGRIPEYAREVTGYSTNGVYQAQQMGRYQLPPQTGSGNITIPYNDNLGIWNGKIQMNQPQVTGLGQTYAMQGGQQQYKDYLAGNPGVASANLYRGTQQTIRQSSKQIRRENPKTLMQARESAINEQKRLAAEEEYVKQVAVQEGLQATDALGGKGFAKPAPIMDRVKEIIYRKAPSEVEKQINVLQSRYDGLSQAASQEVEDIVPGSPLPLNMMSNAKGNFEELPVALKQRVIEEEIYRKQVEQAQNQYNIEQARYQNDLKEQMRQAAAIRNTQMDAAKKAQAAAEQMLASSKAANDITTQNNQIQYLTGDILDPYYDENITQTQVIQQQPIDLQGNPSTYNTIKRKNGKSQNNSDYEAQQIIYPGVAPENVARISGVIPSGGTYGAG